ncbi:MAG: secondary thiamine-phosphate synthase enzyme YjbQ [Phycisphaerae bacterium]|nr:secondary thiamine-phosphate synthase enzyme YjbQ [Phycisphaerae bacterium]
METISIKTQQPNEFVDITRKISEIVAKSGVINGLAVIHVPHTTAGVTINENADPDVVHDILLTLDALIPHHRNGYLHSEGNSDAHVKSSLVGSSLTVIVNDGRLVLGTWQGIYFCEFDGPRNRHLLVKVQ